MSFFCVCLSFKKSYDFEFYCHNHDYYKWLLNKSCISNNILNLLLGSLTGFNSSFIRIQQYMKKQRLFVQMEHVACRYIWKILYIVNKCMFECWEWTDRFGHWRWSYIWIWHLNISNEWTNLNLENYLTPEEKRIYDLVFLNFAS